MNRNLVGSILGRSSVQNANLRRLKCEKLTDDGRQVMAKAHLAKKAHIAFGKVS
jgi:hypothetical protein